MSYEMQSAVEVFLDRLNQLIGDGSARSFALKAGIGETTLRGILNGSLPRLDNLLLIAKAGNVSVSWLVGEEDSHKQLNDDCASYSVTKSDFVEIPFYKVDISAGHGNHVDSEIFKPLIFRRDSGIFEGLCPDHLVGGRVGGDSMLPLILPDSDVLIDKTDKKMSDGKIYVFNADEHLLVKKIVVTFDGYIARSLNNENNENPDIALTKEKIDSLNVVGRARITLPFRRL